MRLLTRGATAADGARKAVCGRLAACQGKPSKVGPWPILWFLLQRGRHPLATRRTVGGSLLIVLTRTSGFVEHRPI